MSEAIAPGNSAEERVLQAFRDGEREIIVHPNGISNTAGSTEWPTVENWQGQDAILHAGFLRSLFLGSDDRFATRSVIISCARIEGRLNLDYCESRFPLNFFWCIFPEGISLQAAVIPELALTKCLIGQADQPSQLYAPKVKVTTNVALIDQFKAFGKVNLDSADIGGRLDCTASYFKEGLEAKTMKTREDAFLRSEFKSNGAKAMFKSKGAVDLSGANISGQLDCTGGHFERGLKARNLKTGTNVFLRSEFNLLNDALIRFKSNGAVDLSGANIVGQLDCAGGHFNSLQAQNLKTGQDVFLYSKFSRQHDGEKALFKSDGAVDLFGANIGGLLNCAGGEFDEGLEARSLRTGGDVFLCSASYYRDIYHELDSGEMEYRGSVIDSHEFRSDGVVDLGLANIGGQLACVGGHFEKGIAAQNLKTGENVLLVEGFKSKGKVILRNANIGSHLYCDGESHVGMDLSGAVIGGVLSCNVGHFRNGLLADGLRYQSIELGGGWEKGLSWLSKMPESKKRFSSQPYEQLMMVYRRMGNLGWARRIGFEMEKKRHERSKWLKYAWSFILKWTIGYGYKPFRSLLAPIGLLLLGAMLFSTCTQNFSSKFTSCGCTPAFLANEWIPSEGKALEYWGKNGRIPQGYPDFHPFIYSLEATFPALSLGQLDKWHTENIFFRWVRWILTFIGSVLLAISTLFRLGFFFPDWKNKDDSG